MDPDLGHRLDDQELPLATRQVVGTLEVAEPGSWEPRSLAEGKNLFGGLILDGLIVRELRMGETVSAELLGDGDIILPSDADEVVPFIPSNAAWTVLSPARIAWLDAPFAIAVRRWPELGAALLERSHRRADRLAVTQAIAQLTRVDDRVLALLWHLGERWGRVTPKGLVVPLRLTHRALARLIGARRPSVTTAITGLERRELLVRRDDGAWLLTGTVPTSLSNVGTQRSPWREGRGPAAGLVETPSGQPELQHHVTELAMAQVNHAQRVETALARARALQEQTEALRESILRSRRQS